MILCDLCNASKRCLRKVIDGKMYDICGDCWKPIEAKLKGKGRPVDDREIVYLPPPRIAEPKEEKPQPGEPPKIWGHRDLH